MKKVIRIIAITLGVILILLITLPILFKSKIEAIVKKEINKQVEATVDWDKFSLSFFRGFPDLSVNLHDLSVIGHAPFEGDTLMALKRFELRVKPFSALKDQVIVKSILLDRPLVNGIILEDGTANYDIVPPGERAAEKEKVEKPEEVYAEEDAGSSDTGEKGSSMGISLKRFAIMNARISYADASGDLYASIADLSLEVSGDFGMEQTDVQMQMNISGIDARSGGIGYMKKGTVDMDVVAAADLVNSVYTLKKNEIRINGLVLGAEGTVEMPEDGSIIPHIQFATRETSFQTLLSMVPAIYLQDFESLETSGNLALEGTISGVMKDSILPDVTLQLLVTDGFFSYPDLPKDVSDVQIGLDVNYRGADMDATTVNLNRFHMLLGGNPFDMNLQVDHPFSDMHVAGMVKGKIDFATLKDIVPMEDIELAGRLETDLGWDTRMSFIENEEFEKVTLDGRLIIEDVQVEAPDIPVPVQLQKLAMFFTPRFVNLETMDLNMGASDLHLDGRLTNFIPYVFDDQTIAGTLNVRSALLDANELMPTAETDVPGENPDGDMEPAPADSLSEVNDIVAENAPPAGDSLALPSQVKIPANIDFKMALDIQNLIYDNIEISNLAGNLRVQEGVAYLEDLGLNVVEGQVTLSGTVDTREAFTRADVDLDLSGIDIPASYETFVAIEKLAPIARHCKGKANVDMKLSTLLDAGFNPIYGSIDADGHLFARNLKVEQPAALEKLASTLKNEKLRNLELDKADIRFSIRDGRVIVQPFDMNFEDSRITASGSHGIDQTMDYTLDMKIAKKDLGAGANELMNSVSALATGAGLNIRQSETLNVIAKITGTFKDPKIKTDLGGNVTKATETVKESVKQEVKEEVERVKDEVKEKTAEEAAAIISNAEAEKARLVKQAEEAGAQLVSEAEKRGDQLIKDAGGNPLKQIAAKKAATELKEQAEKQSAQLVQEANQKGDAIIAKAKEEAAKLE